jgi:hypothetical protein
MSDADNQMGGHGGETGKDPAEGTNEAPDEVTGNAEKDSGQADDESGESFPASDPPANY